MLKTLDILIGLSVVMLLLSMIVTVITQVVTGFLNSRGKHLLQGIADILEQMDPGISRVVAEEISGAVLTHPLVRVAKGKLGSVVHREELTKLLLEFAAGEGPKKLSTDAVKALQDALVATGVCDQGTPQQIQQQISAIIKNIGLLSLQLELARPELTNAARARIALQAFTSSYSRIRQFAPDLSSERSIAFMLDVANQSGDGGAEKLYNDVHRPRMNETDLLEAIAEETTNRVDDSLKAGVRWRREQFLQISQLSDRVFDLGLGVQPKMDIVNV